ncbi:MULTISPECIES: A/G-specific adenine glycosylase [Roseiflexus]|jgi:A/G-specific adenine glycosylase|uniref:Adenine DNA glycosylase n=1 Tax=Roseiflexus castenholzii (strain DSM 13941 / HLO8) TaxID=383372 RepID=A7NN47_ROSCS|nr:MULTISPECIES: A/G-specific adenine glycosylase [Roseiflexus]ABU58979.1 HhH-GPD family protein [Roseiflexus castenholzii DSM 13941]GIW02009.1 MAG: (Fe-S)-cluster assembly protein [Roseiflexus sp.]
MTIHRSIDQNHEHSLSLNDLHQALLKWFSEAARDLPWRRTRDPYRILVAEVMLQQTQVDRVLPKYAAFLERFPTLHTLAEAPTAEVIRMWAGLGYNRRAVNLQRAARAICARYGGVFPRDVATLVTLPGIGSYTAGAVACFAFEQDVAFMDTNIRRVIRRVFTDPTETVNERALLALARAALPVGRSWMWNQALMELGSLVCTADAPACWRCPLRDQCRDYAARRESDERFASAPVRKRLAERRERPFIGSNRYFRGRIIEALRMLPSGATFALNDLGPQVRPEYTPDDEVWLTTLIRGLERDGLVVWTETGVRLPE